MALELKFELITLLKVWESEVNFFACNFLVNWNVKVTQLSELSSPQVMLTEKKLKRLSFWLISKIIRIDDFFGF